MKKEIVYCSKQAGAFGRRLLKWGRMASAMEYMMTVSGETELKGYCDTLFAELYEMKSRIGCFVDELRFVRGFDSTMQETHKRHLKELIETIDWKLEILTKVCPYEWKGLGKDI